VPEIKVPAASSTPGAERSALAPSPSTLSVTGPAPLVTCGTSAISLPSMLTSESNAWFDATV
jgi:hypothetical protein